MPPGLPMPCVLWKAVLTNHALRGGHPLMQSAACPACPTFVLQEADARRKEQERTLRLLRRHEEDERRRLMALEESRKIAGAKVGWLFGSKRLVVLIEQANR
jgi:hypothetical protein